MHVAAVVYTPTRAVEWLNRRSPHMKSSTEHINYLDGWRGLAIALVLEGHFLGMIPLETGRMGVDIFFCL